MDRLPPTHIPANAAAITAGTAGVLQLLYAVAGGIHEDPTVRWSVSGVVLLSAFIVVVTSLGGQRFVAGSGIAGLWFAIYLGRPVDFRSFEGLTFNLAVICTTMAWLALILAPTEHKPEPRFKIEP